MTWILVSIGLGVAGVAVLGVAAARVTSAAAELNRTITHVRHQFHRKEDAGG
ncbi:hypothetical protein OUY22_12955 [Nonomuraea sp. MCN248]|uniref:DUF948 domain-containing protein n=1 Tax=Nonomuraea corallina TaxID=2989783 RepID=A0ABT4SAT9_9ACTN|nr:hypothetical protein [Nonomuraea corallina]MDA0634327.1 hypothetical protein [Nonomuraea corallina]